jgi:hypothetical protein
MSTKTTFKRIALVAVAALGLGVLSVAPSSAAISAVSITAADGKATLQSTSSAKANADTTTAAYVTVAGLLADKDNDSLTVQAFEKSKPAGASSLGLLGFYDTTSANSTRPVGTGSGASFSSDSGTVGSKIYVETAVANGYVGAKYWIQLDTSTATIKAGTYTFTVLVKQYTTGTTATGVLSPVTTTQDVSIVVGAASNEGETPSAAYSAAWLGTTGNPTSDSSSISAVATASTSAVAKLNVQVRNSKNAAFAVDTITIVVTGPGLVYDGTSYSKYVKVVGQTGDVTYNVVPDGASGKTSISVSYEVAAISFTKNLTFYAKNATTLTASVRTPLLKAGANSSAVGVTAVDANGNAWTGTAYVVASSAADALIAGSTTPVACKAWNAADGIRCDVTALTVGTAKFKVIDAATVADAKATSAEFSLTVSAATAAGVKVEFDKASYAPYEKAIITVYPVDAAGNTIPAGTFADLLASGGITATQSFTGTSDTLTATSITTATASSSSSGAIALKAFYTVYMPAQGSVTLSWTGGASVAAAGQVKGSTTASVVNNAVDAATDAANEATDAANAATDAALAAADAADAATAAAQDASDAVAALSATVAKLVASLKAQITSLTNLVIKIQKKVKA